MESRAPRSLMYNAGCRKRYWEAGVCAGRSPPRIHPEGKVVWIRAQSESGAKEKRLTVTGVEELTIVDRRKEYSISRRITGSWPFVILSIVFMFFAVEFVPSWWSSWCQTR